MTGLRIVTLVDAVVFLVAALLNFGLRFTVFLGFPVPVWQAGAGEAVIGVLFIVAAIRDRSRLYGIAYLLSVLGIAFGLLSPRVEGPARTIHVVLVPLAILGIALLVWRRRASGGSAATGAAPSP
jgi:asparagine N-glycosylation enzyme membrane subunit Stt3